MLVAALTTVVAMYLIGGRSTKTAAAILASILGGMHTGSLEAAFGRLAGISGYNVSDIEQLEYVAQMTGITTVIVAKTLVPVALISMTYGVFYLLGSRVLFAGEGAYRKKWALPAFLLCTDV